MPSASGKRVDTVVCWCAVAVPMAHLSLCSIRDYLISQGVPADEILIETQSRNTRENALYARSFLDALPGKKVLLTSDYHMYRAQRVVCP